MVFTDRPMAERLITAREFVDWLRTIRQLVAIVTTAAASLIAIRYFVNGGAFAGYLTAVFPLAGLSADLQRLICWAAGSVLFYFIIPATVLMAGGKTICECGWNIRGFGRHWLTYCILFLPVAGAVALVSGRADFLASYPFLRFPADWREFIVWECCYVAQFIALEFFFRGFLVLGLREHTGPTAAVVIMLLPYVMIHFGKPCLETCGALIAGVALGFLSLRTGSIAGGAILHVMVAVQMDLFALARKGWF
jgi:uncharacterized protein